MRLRVPGRADLGTRGAMLSETDTSLQMAQGGGYPPGGPYGGGGFGPPGAPPGGGGFAPGGGGFAPPGGPPGGKPITGGKQTIAMHQMTIDPATGLPKGENPPASTAAVLALVCGLLLCLGPLTGIAAIIAGFMGMRAAKADAAVGGYGIAMAGLILGVLNLLLSAVGVVLMFLGILV